MNAKRKRNLKFQIITVIIVFAISFIGSYITSECFESLNEAISERPVLETILLLPSYLVAFLLIIAAELFFERICLLTAIFSLILILLANLLFTPENGYITAYRCLSMISCGIMLSAISMLIIIPICFLANTSLLGVLLIIPVPVGMKLLFLKFMDAIEKDFESYLTYYDDIPRHSALPVLLCDTLLRVSYANDYATSLFNNCYGDLKGVNAGNLLTDEEKENLFQSAVILRSNSSLNRFFISQYENGSPCLTLTALRTKKQALVGFIVKKEIEIQNSL